MRWPRAGHSVTCLKGAAATCPDPLKVDESLAFTTNEDLAAKLAALSEQGAVGAIFHPAALCDFKVEEVQDDDGTALISGKFPTRKGRLWLALTPTIKVLPLMRKWFPEARIVGWKYEVEGSPEDVLRSVRRQFTESSTDACVANGPAWGDGFAWVTPTGEVVRLPSNETLIEHLVGWVAGQP